MNLPADNVYLVVFPVESQYKSLLARFYDSEKQFLKHLQIRLTGFGNPGGREGLEDKEIWMEGSRVQKILPSVRGLWIFSGTTHSTLGGYVAGKICSQVESVFNLG